MTPLWRAARAELQGYFVILTRVAGVAGAEYLESERYSGFGHPMIVCEYRVRLQQKSCLQVERI